MNGFKLLITSHSFGSCGKDVFSRLSGAGIDYHMIHSKEILREEELCALIGEYDGAIVGADIVSRRVIESGKNLKIIAKHGVGLDNIDLVAARGQQVAVTFAKNSNSVAVAELAIGMFFSLARNLTGCTADVKAERWMRRKGLELSTATLGVIGTGNIGREVICRMEHLCDQILAYDAYPDTAFAQAHRVRYTSLEELLSASDLVTLHIPLSAETRALIRADTLALMKPSVLLINTARGELLSEDDVCAALESGHLGGVGVDAFAKEPPWGSRLLGQERVILTPHIGAYTDESINKMSQYSAQSVIAYVKGEEIPNQVI